MYYPRPFEYFSPSYLDEALKILDEHKGDAVILAGGQSLIPLLKLRMVSQSVVVDINRIKELEQVNDGQNHLSIGAMVRHSRIERDERIRRHAEILSVAASHIGDPAIRNLGTIGGNLSHCDPSSDYIPVCMVLGAEVKIMSLNSERVVAVDDFVKGPLQTDVRPGELVTEVRVPKLKEKEGCAFFKHEVVPGDFAVINLAAYARVNGKRLEDVRLAVGGIVPRAARLTDVEESLRGENIRAISFDNVGKTAASQVNPQSDWRASSDYRLHLIKVVTPQVLKTAISNAVGGWPT